MPISGREFESGHIEPTLFILQILQDAFPDALSLSDLLAEADSEGRDLSLRQLKDITDRLIDDDKVESKSFEDVIYYRYWKRPLGFRSAQR